MLNWNPLKATLAERGMTVTRFAEIMEVSQPQMAMWISGSVYPASSVIDDMCHTLECDVEEVVVFGEIAKKRKREKICDSPSAEDKEYGKFDFNAEKSRMIAIFDVKIKEKFGVVPETVPEFHEMLVRAYAQGINDCWKMQ